MQRRQRAPRRQAPLTGGWSFSDIVKEINPSGLALDIVKNLVPKSFNLEAAKRLAIPVSAMIWGISKGRADVPYPKSMPPKRIVWEMVAATYINAPPMPIKAAAKGKWWVVRERSQTMILYELDPIGRGTRTFVVAIRGSADLGDVRADIMIAINRLATSDRYNDDEKQLKQWRAKYADDKPQNWFAVGHSLGGAIADSFIKKGLIEAAVSYNPAIEPHELKSLKNYRIYMHDDPLWALMGSHSDYGEVRGNPKRPVSMDAHGIANFKGGVALLSTTPPLRQVSFQRPARSRALIW